MLAAQQGARGMGNLNRRTRCMNLLLTLSVVLQLSPCGAVFVQYQAAEVSHAGTALF